MNSQAEMTTPGKCVEIGKGNNPSMNEKSKVRNKVAEQTSKEMNDKTCLTPRKHGTIAEPVMKLPSDTTIYALALKRMDVNKEKPGELMEKISNFFEEIRLETISHAISPKSDRIVGGAGGH